MRMTTGARGTAGVRSSLLLTCVIPAMLLAGDAWAAQPDLYSAVAIVTGKDNLPERARGIREALPLVLAKVTADAEVAVRAVSEGLVAQAEALVVGLDYRDRKEGIQISDEQGTRDRSFELTVHFDPEGIDAMLSELGAEPWRGERPEIGVALVVSDGVAEYLVTRNSDRGYGQRLAIGDEAKALGLPVVLPDDVPEGATVSEQLARIALDSPVRLQGRMEMTPAGYWNTGWQLTAAGIDDRFTFQNTTFDEAIARALSRSAKRLAKR